GGESVCMWVGGVRAWIEGRGVQRYLEGCDGVSAVHDLHIWSMSTTETALTAHLVTPAGHPGDQFLIRTASALHEHFGIGHATLQIEVSAETACKLAPDHVV